MRGKGGKGRVAPFGDRSLVSLVKYLNKRNKLFGKEKVLFLTKFGDPLDRFFEYKKKSLTAEFF